MTLTELHRRVAALRGLPVSAAHAELSELVEDLSALAHDAEIRDETAMGLLTRSLRALRPRTTGRPATRQDAIETLREVLAAGPRQPGRPSEGSPRTVRAAPEVWAAVDEYAARNGLSESRAAAELLSTALGFGPV